MNNRLYDLKDWLTVSEATNHLAAILSFDRRAFSEKDVLQFALEGKLKLSIFFPSDHSVRKAEFLPMAKKRLEDRTVLPGGMFDLLIIEGGINYLSFEINNVHKRRSTKPLFIENRAGEKFCLIEDDYSWEPHFGNYLPEGCRLVIRKKQLDNFIHSQKTKQYEKPSNNQINASPEKKVLAEKDLGATERKKLHLIIVALVELAELNDKPDNTIAKNIGYKVDVSQNTIVKHLRAAFNTQEKAKP